MQYMTSAYDIPDMTLHIRHYILVILGIHYIKAFQTVFQESMGRHYR